MLLSNVKLFATVSFLLTIVSLAGITFAQVAYYGIDTVLDDSGNADVKITITFKEAVKTFSYNILGRITDFNATSNAGPVSCDVSIKGTSLINCNLSLTADKRTLFLNFRTDDFVKQLDDRFFFSGDFSIDVEIEQLFSTLKLPDRAIVVKEAGRISFSDNANVISEGRIVVWSIPNIAKGQNLRLEALYEKLPPTFFEQLRLHQIAIFGLAVGAVIAFLLLRYFKKSEQLVLSVLDEFERKVVDIVAANQGEVNQRKVVLESNLSKAKVSRVVKSLAERGLIEVQRLGRTNKLRLIKKKLTP